MHRSAYIFTLHRRVMGDKQAQRWCQGSHKGRGTSPRGESCDREERRKVNSNDFYESAGISLPCLAGDPRAYWLYLHISFHPACSRRAPLVLSAALSPAHLNFIVTYDVGPPPVSSRYRPSSTRFVNRRLTGWQEGAWNAIRGVPNFRRPDDEGSETGRHGPSRHRGSTSDSGGPL